MELTMTSPCLKERRIGAARLAGLVVFVLLAATSAETLAQTSSLLSKSAGRRPLTLTNYSWPYQAPVPAKEIKINDIVTIIVKDKSMVTSEAETDRKKKASVAAVLKDWVLLPGLLTMIPDPQSKGDPKVTGSLDNKLKAEGNFNSRESIQFTIACHVVDIRDNGHLIIEGRRTIQNNNEVWNQALTGEIRPEDVQPNNTVLSENVADIRVHKWESGSVRDSYRRGWFLRWLDKWQPW